MKNLLPLSLALLLTLFGGFSGASVAATTAVDVRLYRLDCGNMHLNDLSLMSDTGEYKGRMYDVVISCYLIKHGKDWMLWDTGFAKNFTDGVTMGSLDMKLATTIVDQLRTIGLESGDIGYVALSHAHFDHTGQTGDFPHATLIMQKREYAVLADKNAAREHMIFPELLGQRKLGHKAGELKLVDDGYDFFGDGTVKAILLPGHTPGHMALQLKLPDTGPVILSGDQWHFTENRAHNLVPQSNFSHDDTVQSGQRLEALIRKTGAKLIIQHEPADNTQFPALPGFLN